MKQTGSRRENSWLRQGYTLEQINGHRDYERTKSAERRKELNIALEKNQDKIQILKNIKKNGLISGYRCSAEDGIWIYGKYHRQICKSGGGKIEDRCFLKWRDIEDKLQEEIERGYILENYYY